MKNVKKWSMTILFNLFETICIFYIGYLLGVDLVNEIIILMLFAIPRFVFNGARGRDMRYRGDEELDRMSGEYGRYMESRNRYGASEETDKSYHYMVKALEDFIKVLYEEADNEQQKNMLRETLQNSMR